MLRIRVKGKYIVAFCLSLLLAAGVLYAIIPSVLYKMASSAEDDARREAYYNFLIKGFPKSSEGIRALFFSAQQEVPTIADGDEPGLIYLFPSSTGMSNGNFDREKVQAAIEKFLLVRERAPESPWSTHSLYELGKAYFALGDYQKAEDYLKKSIGQTDMEASGSTGILIEMYLLQERYVEALELAERSLKEKPGQNPLEMLVLKGRALMALERWDEARQVFKKIPGEADALYSEILADEGPEAINMNVQEYDKLSAAYLKRLELLSKGTEPTGAIGGQVTIDGRPASGVRVYLIDKSLNEDYYTGTTRGLPRVITGESGEYTFEGLAPGRYALGVGVKIEDVEGSTLQQWKGDIVIESGQEVERNIAFVPTVSLESPLANDEVKGKIIFRWKPVEGAVRYEVFVGPVDRDDGGNISTNYTSGLEPKITGGPLKKNQAVVDLSKMQMRLRMHGSIAYNDEVNPESILGLFRPGGEYTWGVYAYDDKGNRISDSAGMIFYEKKEIPVFKVKGEPTEADKLLLDRKYGEAIEAYKAQLREKPDDEHALLALARLNQYGVKYDERNLEEAAKYYEKLTKVQDVPEVRDALAGVYFDAGEFQKAEALYQTTLGTSAESWYTHFQLAKIKFLDKKPDEALNMLEETTRLEGGQYARAYPVALALLMGESQRAVAIAKVVDEGEEYLKLLEQYVTNYNLNGNFKNAMLQGEYEKARSTLSETNQQDIFLKGLLDYLTEEPGRERTEKIADISEKLRDNLLAGLIKSMLL